MVRAVAKQAEAERDRPEQNSTIVFPMPIDIVRPFLEILDKAGKAPSANGAARVPRIETIPSGVSATNP